ncbi:hypothetical protein B7R54_08400 [Subtercola boreus]|uniref:Luciferase-like domain-containing protein n=1 Tax=Subtercola boreus TaxID=120213 RepID=A0A3E0VIC1_9MICO|nr:NtaA/DmoA family FMN-dependent monooxygenase [Subtercola boreus]RFA09243.1 hypothetical protein B7R54_08400 [Subtercola boreus]TQL53730.1 FMN-dependent oxidoreductase (nitrilotriacetate monooxygenase family) [Subtercola boreus]
MTGQTRTEPDGFFTRSGHVVLGSMVRTLGAFPSGWRMPGAHADPAADPRALKRLAVAAERAHLDFLYFGDWLSTSAELELTDPHLLVRTDPLSTVAWLAALTRRIGLVGTASVPHSDPYQVARSAASIDRLSAGRFGLNLTLGTEPRAAANFGRTGAGAEGSAEANAFLQGDEYLYVVRALWASVDARGVAPDARTGRLTDGTVFAPVDHHGPHYSVAGPLNALPPVAGTVPIVQSGASERSREFAARHADLYLAGPGGLGESIKFYRDTKQLVEAYGRPRTALRIVAPLLPVVASTREEAFDLYDRLADAVLLGESPGEGQPGQSEHPERTVRRLLQLVGLPLASREPGDPVTLADAERFNALGHRLLELVAERSGREPGGVRSVTYRHLLVAHLTPLPLVVGSACDVADHIETWYRASAVDGFTLMAAYLPHQFDAFLDLVVPELVRRGLFRGAYEGRTLAEHLGLGDTAPRAAAAEHPADVPWAPCT